MPTTDDHARRQAAAQYDSIREMVAALECDYDRLDELRDEQQSLTDELEELRDALEAARDDAPDDELRKAEEAEADKRCELEQWDADNAEELRGLIAAAGECEDADDARQRIEEDALSVEVRSDWVSPGAEMTASEFCIVLCTGGPAARICGELDDNGEPRRAWLEYQDWGTPWTEYVGADQDTLLAYARCFVYR